MKLMKTGGKEKILKTGYVHLFGLILALGAFVVLSFTGKSCVVDFPVNGKSRAEDVPLIFSQDEECVEIQNMEIKEDRLYVTLRSKKQGKVYLAIEHDDYSSDGCVLYVHKNGIITVNEIFGKCRGDFLIPAVLFLYLLLLLFTLSYQLKKRMAVSMYDYANVSLLGLIVFLGFLTLSQLVIFLHYRGLINTVTSTLYAARNFSTLGLPLAFVVSVLVSISNIDLMKKEGRNWRNMLGFILGIFFCFSTLVPFFLEEWLQRTTIVDVHNMNGPAYVIEMFVENGISVVVAYLECILLATVYFGIHAARHVPSYDQDYMIILGCQIRKDGTLTPLLQSRADRALEFAKAQKEHGGKKLVFVPSGGQGADECVAEADAIADYLLTQNIPEERILRENKATDTAENFRFSKNLIDENKQEKEAKIAFSTTNYHVFRSGMIALEQGIHAEGVGSATKRYFWINAFIREYIATLYAQKKQHLRIILALLVIVAVLSGIVFISANL